MQRSEEAWTWPTIYLAVLPMMPTVVDVGNDGHVPDVVLLVLCSTSKPRVSVCAAAGALIAADKQQLGWSRTISLRISSIVNFTILASFLAA